MPLRKLVIAEKRIPIRVEWTSPERDGYVRFLVPLEIDGIVDAGLTLSGGAYHPYRDQHVSLELAILDHNGSRRIRLARIDWKSLRKGHSNNARKCAGPWGGERVPETHLHSFDLNYIEAEGRMKAGKLPCAEPIPEPLQTFKELRRFCGTCFKINNIDIVPPPDWEYDLFDE